MVQARLGGGNTVVEVIEADGREKVGGVKRFILLVFGRWSAVTVVYRRKAKSRNVIERQLMRIRILGSGGRDTIGCIEWQSMID